MLKHKLGESHAASTVNSFESELRTGPACTPTLLYRTRVVPNVIYYTMRIFKAGVRYIDFGNASCWKGNDRNVLFISS